MEKGKAQPLSRDDEKELISKIQKATSVEKLQGIKEGLELGGHNLADYDLETLFTTRVESFSKKAEEAKGTIADDGKKAAETAATLAGDEARKTAEKMTNTAQKEVIEVEKKVQKENPKTKQEEFNYNFKVSPAPDILKDGRTELALWVTVTKKTGGSLAELPMYIEVASQQEGMDLANFIANKLKQDKTIDASSRKGLESLKQEWEKNASSKKNENIVDLEKLKQEIGGKQKILANLQEEYDILKDAAKGANDNITPQLEDLKLRMTDLEKEIAAGKAQYEAAIGTAKTSPVSKEAPATDKKESVTSKETSISKEEFQNFVDKNVISVKVLVSIAEKIKGNKQLSPEEQSVLAHRGEDIESILKGEVKKEQKASPTVMIDSQIAALEKQLAEKSANEKAGDAADIQELDYQIRQLRKEREAILANPEKHEGQLDDASDALKNHLAGGKSNVVETGTMHAEADAEKARIAQEQHEKIKNDLDSARAEYQKLYKEFQSKRGVFKKMWQGLKGGTVDFDDVPEMAEAMKAAQSKYQEALAGYGSDLYQTKKAEYEKHGLAGKDLEQALAVYKAKDIFDTVVLKEKEMMAQEKTAILPEKVKGILGKTLGWYTKLPKGVRMVLSTAIATGILVGTGHVAASGALAYGGYRLGRAAVSGLAGQLAVGTKNLFWNADKDVAKIDKNFEKNKNELGSIEGFDMKALQQMQAALETRLKQEKNARVKHLIVDAGIRLAVGYGAGKLTDKIWSDIHPPVDTPPRTDPNPEPAPITETGPNADAIIHKGEGIEHALRRQIEHDPELATKLGWNGQEDLHHFSAGEAHRIALQNDYVEGTGERWVNWNEGHQTAYQLEVDSNGQPIVKEFFDGTERDTMSQMNDQFVKTDYADSHKYEYLHNKPVFNPDNNGVVVPKPEVKVEIPMEDPNGTIPMEDPNATTIHEKVEMDPLNPINGTKVVSMEDGSTVTIPANHESVIPADQTINPYTETSNYANSVGQGTGINHYPNAASGSGFQPPISMYHETAQYANAVGQGQWQDKFFTNETWNALHRNPGEYVQNTLAGYNPQSGMTLGDYIAEHFPHREEYGTWKEYFKEAYMLDDKTASRLAKSTMTNLKDITDDGYLNQSTMGQTMKQGTKGFFKGLFGSMFSGNNNGNQMDQNGWNGWNGNSGGNYNGNVQGNGIQMGNGINNLGSGNQGNLTNPGYNNDPMPQPKSTWFGGPGW